LLYCSIVKFEEPIHFVASEPIVDSNNLVDEERKNQVEKLVWSSLESLREERI